MKIWKYEVSFDESGFLFPFLFFSLAWAVMGVLALLLWPKTVGLLVSVLAPCLSGVFPRVVINILVFVAVGAGTMICVLVLFSISVESVLNGEYWDKKWDDRREHHRDRLAEARRRSC